MRLQRLVLEGYNEGKFTPIYQRNEEACKAEKECREGENEQEDVTQQGPRERWPGKYSWL